MKKIRRLFMAIAAFCTLCVSFVLAGCSASTEGTYKFYSMKGEKNGIQIEIEVGEKFMGMMTLTEDFITMTLNEDGSVAAISKTNGEEEISTGLWIKSGEENIAITLDGETKNCACDGKTLTIEVDGMTLILKK